MESLLKRPLVILQKQHQEMNFPYPRTSQLCSVCEAENSHSFYGATVCDACRTFFRRHVLKPKVRIPKPMNHQSLISSLINSLQQPLRCYFGSECVINVKQRKSCRACRFNKCLNVGMKKEMVETDVAKNQSQWQVYRKKRRKIDSSGESTTISVEFPPAIDIEEDEEEKELIVEGKHYPSPFTQPSSVISFSVLSPLQDVSLVSTTSPFTQSSSCSSCLEDKLSESSSLSFIPSSITVSDNCRLSLEVLPGSEVELFFVDEDIIPGVSINVLVEIKVHDGIVYGIKGGSFSSMISGRSMIPLVYDNSNKVNPVLIHRRRGYHETHFRLLVQHQFPCDVEITSSSSQISTILPATSIMVSMDKCLWKILAQVVSAASLFHELFRVEYFLPSPDYDYDSIGGTMKRVVFTSALESLIKNLTLPLGNILTSHSVPEKDQEIILLGATTEILIILVLANFDKDRQSIVRYAVFNQVLLLADVNSIHSSSWSQEVLDLFQHLLHDDYDLIRRDEIVMTILCLVCLFKERPGVSCVDLLNNNSSLLFNLLDKYILAKVNSCEWISDSSFIWELVAQYVKTISTQKSFLENFIVSSSQGNAPTCRFFH